MTRHGVMIFIQALDYVGQQVDCLVARYVHVAVYKQNEIGRKMTTSLISPLGAECRMLRALKFGPRYTYTIQRKSELGTLEQTSRAIY